jgi:penicillin-binding protein 1C
MNDRPLRRWVIGVVASVVALLGAVPLSVELGSFFVDLPTELDPSSSHGGKATRVRDRGGVLLAELRVDGKQHLPIAYGDLPPHVVDALLAAEDKRFFSHRGVDWLAVGRALGQWGMAGKVVSGASTLTQQLARSTFARQRTVYGKWREMLLARRIERDLTKGQILEAYLNRIEFGPNVVGLGAAAEAYFAKPVGALSLSEAATLVGIPRGPSLYDPKRPQTPIIKRRDRILERLAENDPGYAEQVARALEVRLELQQQWVAPGAFHWVRRLARDTGRAASAEWRTTLDSALQRRVEQLVHLHANSMQRFGASAAAVLVADNRTQEVLAYVGSPDYRAAIGGQNDGVVALRQPGSTLKPFVYAAAMQHLGYTAATLLPDVPLEFREAGQVYAPRNYDGQFHGPVRLREALANSRNVPAVYTVSQVGVGRVLDYLHRLGFSSLTKAPEYYGVALALGDGEVTLEELVAGYMVLANDGALRPLRIVVDEPVTEPVRAVDARVARVLRDVLQDPLARATSFGRHGVLEFDFPVAVKTGTSKGARDNWTVGFSDEVTVGVWVGNFDGTPMVGASGVSGAGPLFHAVMKEATHWAKRRELGDAKAGQLVRRSAAPQDVTVSRVEICTLSGKLPGAHCPTRVTELFVPGTEPREPDDMHVALATFNGAIAENCSKSTIQVFENYPDRYRAWARDAGRPVVPERRLMSCDGPEIHETTHAEPLAVTFPRDHAEYRLVDDDPKERQVLILRGRANASRVTFLVDGKRYRTTAAPFEVEWPLIRGDHRVQLEADDGELSEVVHFRVR